MARASADIRRVRNFEQLREYLADALEWPVDEMSVEDLTFDYDPEKDLGLDPKTAAKIRSIKQLREVDPRQPFGIFFIEFEPKSLPVVALRRILARLVTKKRESANPADRKSWDQDDLLFISACGEDSTRRIDFAHFAPDAQNGLPTLRVLGWDADERPLKAEYIEATLREKLAWPEPGELNRNEWRTRWREAFVLRPREVIETSKALAVRLAALARDIRKRANSAIAVETEKGPLRTLMRAFRESLIHDLKEDDFADMYAQTIAYGLLSARISRPEGLVADNLADMVPITNPFLKELLGTFINLGGRKWSADQGEIIGIDFDELGVNEVVETLRDANMEAVLRDFDNRNPREDPVIHFYELFLKEYDPKKRMQRGVFYTPKPVVSFIVRSVHELLQTEFGLADGLADTATWADMLARNPGLQLPEVDAVDPETRRVEKRPIDPSTPFVQILDPATGTATFLVEVIDTIHRTMLDRWKREGVRGDLFLNQKWNEYVPRHLLPRLHGYELMMAPYAIAHMKIGLKLFETGYEFASDERARVYLTNALEPPRQFQATFDIAALAHEADAVSKVKRDTRFTVVIGNPPYAGISSNMTERAKLIVDAYKHVDGKSLNERKLWLQDDYVKFVRIAQEHLNASRAGILGFITNHGYLDNPTFRGMRRSLMQSFGLLHMLDLHGNLLKKERAPDGTEDRNVFDIRQGVAILLGACGIPGSRSRTADLWGPTEGKYGWLSKHLVSTTRWHDLHPLSPFYFFKAVDDVDDSYHAWPSLAELLPTYSSGVITARDELVLDFSDEAILKRIALLREDSVSDAELRHQLFRGKGSPKYPPGDSRGWKLPEARVRLQQDVNWNGRVTSCLYRPFDARRVYLVEWMVDWSRPEIRRHLTIENNLLLVFPRNTGASKPWDHVFVSRVPILGRFFPDSACITYMAPALLCVDAVGSEASALSMNAPLRGCGQVHSPEESMRRLAYMYALLHSPSFRQLYASQLRADFPRIPLTASTALHHRLSVCGAQLIAIHLLESPTVGTPITTYRGPQSPAVDKVSYSNEAVWLDKAKSAGFAGVPDEVWNFHIGGYQVCHKWLKDRKGRTLTDEDIAHYQKIVVALKETIRIMAEIDEVIDAHGGWPGAFVTQASSDGGDAP